MAYFVVDDNASYNEDVEQLEVTTPAYAPIFNSIIQKILNKIGYLKKNYVSKNDLATVVEISLPVSGWSSTYPHTQSVSNASIKATSEPTMVKTMVGSETEDVVKAYEKAYGMIFSGKTDDGIATFYAKKIPEIDFTVGLKGVQ